MHLKIDLPNRMKLINEKAIASPNHGNQKDHVKGQISVTTATANVAANMIGSGIFISTGFIADLVPEPG
jgi:hypothetical protein